MSGTAEVIADRVADVREVMEAACQRAGRAADTVKLVAVSKTHSAEEVVAAVSAGVRHFGENRIEEALSKMQAVAAQIDTPLAWHMIGHVQSRKARYVTAGFTMLHSLDSVKLASRIDSALAAEDQALDVLLEINVSGEASKEGWHAYGWQDDPALRRVLWEDVAEVLACDRLRVRGLMTMAPIVADMEQARPVFAALRELRDALAGDFPQADWSELSMGMTDDYPVAIEEGATLVRIGRAIFGQRNRPWTAR